MLNLNKMNEMLTLPLFVVLLLLTSVLASIITTMMPMLPKYWYAFKTHIRRVFTRKPKTNVYCDDLSKRIDDLEEQINNIAEIQATQQRNRKYNIRRDVREYLKELQND